MIATEFDLGEGVYSFPEAARIVMRAGSGATARQLRYWLSTGLTERLNRRGDGAALNFHDLVSLEVVRRFRTRNVSLQRVRKLEAGLRARHPGLQRPFAHDVFLTDGVSIWRSDNPDDPEALTEEIVGRRPGHLAWGTVISSFADEVRFDAHGIAVAWDLSKWVEINPAVQFGAPVVRGTRVPAHTIKVNLEVGTPAQVADWYGLTVEHVEGVRAYFAAA